MEQQIEVQHKRKGRKLLKIVIAIFLTIILFVVGYFLWAFFNKEDLLSLAMDNAKEVNSYRTEIVLSDFNTELFLGLVDDSSFNLSNDLNFEVDEFVIESWIDVVKNFGKGNSRFVISVSDNLSSVKIDKTLKLFG